MCHLLSVCIRSVNNTQIDNAEDVDVVMPMYNLTEHTDNIQKLEEVYGNFIEMWQMI